MKRTLKVDHEHTCTLCGWTFPCREYTLQGCKKAGVFKSVKVNKEGPYCTACVYMVIAVRTCRLENRDALQLLNLALAND